MHHAAHRRAIRLWTCPNAGRWFSLAFVLGGVLIAEPVGAQTAVAEALFNDGRALMEAGELEQACPKLAESHRLDPATGTLLNLGICYQKAGKTASAWLAFKEAVVFARRENRPERVAFAEKQVAELAPTLSYLTVRVDPKNRVEGLSIRVDETEFVAGAWGTAVPTDPGRLWVRAMAPGRKTWVVEVNLGLKGDRHTVVVPRLELPLPELDLGPEEAPKATPSVSQPSGADAGAKADGNRTLGYVIGGVGLLGLGVGSYFGVKALSSWSDRNDHCTDAGCDEDAVTYGDDAKKYGNVANVGLGLGVVGVGVGAYLLLTSPELKPDRGSVRIEPVVARDVAGVGVGGVW
jgi:hypothetical protein